MNKAHDTEGNVMNEIEFWHTGGDHIELDETIRKLHLILNKEEREEIDKAVSALVNRHVFMAITEYLEGALIYPSYSGDEDEDDISSQGILRLGLGGDIEGIDFALENIFVDSELFSENVCGLNGSREKWANHLEEIARGLRAVNEKQSQIIQKK